MSCSHTIFISNNHNYRVRCFSGVVSQRLGVLCQTVSMRLHSDIQRTHTLTHTDIHRGNLCDLIDLIGSPDYSLCFYVDKLVGSWQLAYSLVISLGCFSLTLVSLIMRSWCASICFPISFRFSLVCGSPFHASHIIVLIYLRIYIYLKLEKRKREKMFI